MPTMPIKVRNYLLESSPTATFIMDLPQVPQKRSREDVDKGTMAKVSNVIVSKVQEKRSRQEVDRCTTIKKEDFYYTDLTLKCRLAFAKEIKTHMGNLTGRELISRFQLTPFGPWLHVTMTDGHPTLVHMFLQMEVIVRNADRDVMYFDVYGRHMHFGSAEFCLLTGLRFGPEPSLPPLATDGFVSRVWPGINPEDLKIDMVVQRVKRGLRDYSDDDIIRVCIVLMVEVMFMGRELYSIVSETVLRAVEDLDTCSRFPWGSYIWAHTFKQLHLAIMRRKDKHSKMTLSGFVYAFKIWIVEMFPVAQENFILRNDRFIRGTRWDRAAVMNKSTCLAMFNSVNSSRPPLGELEPTDAELAQPWFHESIAFIRRSAERPSTKRSRRSSPDEDDEDDEDDAQPQHLVGVNDRYEAPPPLCYSHDGMSHPDPYQAKWDELSALDRYVREKHEKRLKVIEDICSQFNVVHTSIPQPSYIPAGYTQATPETFATTSTFNPQNFQTSGADCYVPQIAMGYDMSSYVTPPGYMMPGSSYVTSTSTGYMQNVPHKRSRQEAENGTMANTLEEKEKQQTETVDEEKRILEAKLFKQDEVIAEKKAMLEAMKLQHEKRMLEKKIHVRDIIIAQQKLLHENAMLEEKMHMQDKVIAEQKAMLETMKMQNEKKMFEAKILSQDKIIAQQKAMLEALKLAARED